MFDRCECEFEVKVWLEKLSCCFSHALADAVVQNGRGGIEISWMTDCLIVISYCR